MRFWDKIVFQTIILHKVFYLPRYCFLLGSLNKTKKGLFVLFLRTANSTYSYTV